MLLPTGPMIKAYAPTIWIGYHLNVRKLLHSAVVVLVFFATVVPVHWLLQFFGHGEFFDLVPIIIALLVAFFARNWVQQRWGT